MIISVALLIAAKILIIELYLGKKNLAKTSDWIAFSLHWKKHLKIPFNNMRVFFLLCCLAVLAVCGSWENLETGSVRRAGVDEPCRTETDSPWTILTLLLYPRQTPWEAGARVWAANRKWFFSGIRMVESIAVCVPWNGVFYGMQYSRKGRSAVVGNVFSTFMKHT